MNHPGYPGYKMLHTFALKGGREPACVIGGTSLLNGMTLMAVSPEAKYIARGIVLALAVWLDLRLGKDR